LACGLGLLLVALQLPITALAMKLLDGSPGVEAMAGDYVLIRIWGAPATLATFVLMGLLIGLGQSAWLLYLQLFLNVLNISLDFWFAGVLGMGAAGIALGTVIAEWTTFLIGGLLILRLLRGGGDSGPFWDLARIVEPRALLKTLSVNSDIMIRTLLLVFSFAWFINQSAQFGDVILAANHILLQLVSFSAFFLDGFAFVLESLVGRALGAGQRQAFEQAVRRSTELAMVTAAALAAMIYVLGPEFIAALTSLPAVRDSAVDMRYLAALYVLLAFPAFQLDGIFIGATRTRDMRNASIISMAIFLLAWAPLTSLFGVTGLWWAFIVYVCARAAALMLFYGSLRRIIGHGGPDTS
jgi:MATE family multidrug resistance protein